MSDQAIRTDLWKINMPMFPPTKGVMDNSTESEYSRCPRRGLYRYGLRRGFTGKNYPIQFGLAYHKYRETVENIMLEEGVPMNDEVNQRGVNAALEGWEDPPADHPKWAYLDQVRLHKTLIKARLKIQMEQQTGSVEVTRAEDAFDLELPFWLCEDCGWGVLEKPHECYICGCHEFIILRHGGRVDKFAVFQGDQDVVGDYKTTSRKGKNYEKKFDPNAQIQGYVWAGGELSGRKFEGALIETIYNTKTRGPEITQHFVEYTSGQQEAWLASRMMERSMIHMMWSRVEELGYLAFPQRTNACQDFGGCPFRGACQTGSGWELEQWLQAETIHSEWDFMDPDKEEDTGT